MAYEFLSVVGGCAFWNLQSACQPGLPLPLEAESVLSVGFYPTGHVYTQVPAIPRLPC